MSAEAQVGEHTGIAPTNRISFDHLLKHFLP